MKDPWNRSITYLRISITDRCNLRCRYCMPKEGIPLIPHAQILSYEEITEIARVAVTLGITKIRITGGEPLVRNGMENLIALIAAIPGISDFGLTTNGILLESMASRLKSAGLHRVNVSLDAINPDHYRQRTRGGDVRAVFRGIDAAIEAKLIPVKLNCVVDHSSSEPDAQAVKAFAKERNLAIRFIHQMNLRTGCFSTIENGDGGNCSLCNRLRLTANGKIKPCLFNDLEFDVRQLGIREALVQAIQHKPEKGTLNTINAFNNIGG